MRLLICAYLSLTTKMSTCIIYLYRIPAAPQVRVPRAVQPGPGRATAGGARGDRTLRPDARTRSQRLPQRKSGSSRIDDGLGCMSYVSHTVQLYAINNSFDMYIQVNPTARHVDHVFQCTPTSPLQPPPAECGAFARGRLRAARHGDRGRLARGHPEEVTRPTVGVYVRIRVRWYRIPVRVPAVDPRGSRARGGFGLRLGHRGT